MSTREEYTKCMTPYMTGTGKSKDERQRSMCMGAKLCSGKASSEDEASQLCAEAAANPKPVKERRTRRAKILDPHTTAVCVVDRLSGQSPTVDSLTAALAHCTGQKSKKPRSFIEQCVRENAVTGDLKEIARVRSQCKAEAKSQRQAERGV